MTIAAAALEIADAVVVRDDDLGATVAVPDR
jgi:hypothetical protein